MKAIINTIKFLLYAVFYLASGAGFVIFLFFMFILLYPIITGIFNL